MGNYTPTSKQMAELIAENVRLKRTINDLQKLKTDIETQFNELVGTAHFVSWRTEQLIYTKRLKSKLDDLGNELSEIRARQANGIFYSEQVTLSRYDNRYVTTEPDIEPEIISELAVIKIKMEMVESMLKELNCHVSIHV